MVNGKPNFETIGDVGIMGLNPPLMYVSSHKDHYTNIGILKEGVFSINIPNTNLLAETDYCGTVSGKEVDKSSIFEVFFGQTGAPMIEQCPVNLERKVCKEFSIDHRQAFIGNVIQTHVSEQFLEEREGKRYISGLEKLDPILYSLGNSYYSIGKVIGEGYKEGLRIKQNKLI